MEYNFVVEDRQIIVDDNYVGKEKINKYFSKHKLKKKDFSMEDIEELIDSVAYMLDGLDDYLMVSDYMVIESMLEE